MLLIKIINMVCELLVWILMLYAGFVLIINPYIKKIFKSFRKEELKIFLDDERQEPKGWIKKSNYLQCIEILEQCKVSHLSLDHDLGEEKTGYDVVKWIEEKSFHDASYQPPIMIIHSANPAGRQNMERGIASIQRILNSR